MRWINRVKDSALEKMAIPVMEGWLGPLGEAMLASLGRMPVQNASRLHEIGRNLLKWNGHIPTSMLLVSQILDDLIDLGVKMIAVALESTLFLELSRTKIVVSFSR
jgi:hypothetical protein